jgi:hypothetical protein
MAWIRERPARPAPVVAAVRPVGPEKSAEQLAIEREEWLTELRADQRARAQAEFERLMRVHHGVLFPGDISPEVRRAWRGDDPWRG